jgi:predicted SAM-dependent methyltransferase
MNGAKELFKQLPPIRKIIADRDTLSSVCHEHAERINSTVSLLQQREQELYELKNRDVRSTLSHKFLAGTGIEIGALHGPLPVDRTKCTVKYVDRMDVDSLYRHYPELREHPLVPVDIIDDGEKLLTIQDESQDFIIANHLLEHCQDPIGTLKTFTKKLKDNGMLYLAIPHKAHTFDSCRNCTTLEHLISDHENGPEQSREQHFREWVGIWIKDEKSPEYAARLKELLEMDYSIHFHVWTEKELFELLACCADRYKLPLEVLAYQQDANECIFVVRKNLGAGK